MSQSQKQTLNIGYDVYMRNCHDFKAYVTAVMNKWTCLVSQGRVRTAVRRGGHFCCSFVANLLQYPLAKNYRNIMWFDKVIAKIKKCNFLPNSVVNMSILHHHTIPKTATSTLYTKQYPQF